MLYEVITPRYRVKARAARELYASPMSVVRAFIGLLAQCYYRDDRVMASLGMDPEQFRALGDSFRSPHLWEGGDGKWIV